MTGAVLWTGMGWQVDRADWVSWVIEVTGRDWSIVEGRWCADGAYHFASVCAVRGWSSLALVGRHGQINRRFGAG